MVENRDFLFAILNVIMMTLTILFYLYVLTWPNGLARSAVKRKVGGSSPPRNEPLFYYIFFVIRIFSIIIIRLFTLIVET